MTPRYLTKKFIQVLQEEEVDLKIKSLGGKYSGLYIFGTIYIDHKDGDVLDTLVHELLHHLYEEKHHEWVYKTAKEYRKKSSWKMKKLLLYTLLSRT